MSTQMLESGAISAFCDSVARMLSAGIQTDEAVHLLGDTMQDGPFKETCKKIYAETASGKSLSRAMGASHSFPRYAVDMVAAGEESGRTEQVLFGLSTYYDEEDRLFAKARSAITYPAALLAVMTVILLFTVAVILPVFIDVYANLAGGLTTGSFGFVNVSLVIGWIALVITLVCTIAVLIASAACRGANGRQRLIKMLERMPFARKAMYQLALSRFASALATFIASGIDTNTAMREAAGMVTHKKLKHKLDAAYRQMVDLNTAKSISQALADNDVFGSVYARMLMVGTRTGSIDQVLMRLADTFFDDAIAQIDHVVDGFEPALAAFLTVSVGATLVAVMLPLVAVMGSIG